MTFQKAALIGANGTLGPVILQHLLDANFNVTIITRTSSTSSYTDPRITLKSVPDSMPTDALTTALSNQDAVICCMRAGSDPSTQIRIADAAYNAGVKRFIPADFGSVDSDSELALRLIPMYKAKKAVREHAIALAARGEKEGKGFSWTSLVCAHFFNWGLVSGLLHVDTEKHTARIFDGGDVKWSASSLAQIARATVGILKTEEETRNRMLFVQSACFTQYELVEVLEGVQGVKYQREERGSKEYIDELQGMTDLSKEQEHQRTEDMVGVVGIIDLNCENRDGFANDLLGLENEPLERMVEDALSQSTQN